MSRKWTEDDVKELARLWKGGSTSSALAEKFGVSRSAIMGKIYRLRDQGVIARSAYSDRVERWTDDKMLDLLACRQAGWSWTAIGRYLEMGPYACQYTHAVILRDLERSEAA